MIAFVDQYMPHNALDAGAVAVLLCVHSADSPMHLEEALISIRKQDYHNVRIYVYCDGPISLNLEQVILQQLNIKKDRDHLIRGEKNCGLSIGLNILIDYALSINSVVYLARMDADDISIKTRLSTQVNFLDSNPHISAVGSWCIEFNDEKNWYFEKKLPTLHEDLRIFSIYRSPFVHSSVMFNKNTFDKGLRYCPEDKFAQDYNLWVKMIISGHRLANIPDFLLLFRLNKKFFQRRGGIRRAFKEVAQRWKYAIAIDKLSGLSAIKILLFALVRLLPRALKRLAYQFCR